MDRAALADLSWLLEEELQRQLDRSTRLRLGDLSKRRRADVVVGQAEVRVIEEVKELRAELEALRFTDRDVLEQREVPFLERRRGHDVAAGVSELPRLRGRVQLLKRFHVEPLLNRAWSGIWIADQVRPIAGEAGNFRRLSLQADVGGIVNGKRRAAHDRGDAVGLPVPEDSPIPLCRISK